MFSYYGSKSKIAKHYPKPEFDLIIEPFAGAAHYSMLYYGKQVILNDIDYRVAAIWKYLINACPDEILNLPNVYAGLAFNEITNISNPERDLIRFNTNRGEGNKNVASSYGVLSWRNKRLKMANELEKVRHWEIINGDYKCLDNVKATYFIDPPYENKQGRKYKHNKIDYDELADWVNTRKGQVIVCENSFSKKWMDFEPLIKFRGIGKVSTEVVYHRINGG